jgi:type 1 glutamine amidotransferase
MEMPDLLFVSDVSPYRTVGQAPAPAGTHQSITAAANAVAAIAESRGLDFLHREGAGTVSASELERARILVLFTIGETPWTAQQRLVIEERTGNGTLGLVGMHSATDSAYGWPAFGQLIGARFDGHPVTGQISITVTHPDHPATAHLSSPWLFKDELYIFRDLVPDARVLLAVELGSGLPAVPDSRSDPHLLPLAWSIERGPTRTFYTALGHFSAAYEDPSFIQHVAGGIQWVLDSGKAEKWRN